MPVTPFHGGVGLAAKGIVGNRVSFVGFCAAQVAVDLESGYYLLSDEWPVHRFFHTVIGATVVCGLTVWLCRLLSQWFAKQPGAQSGLVRLVRQDLDPLLNLAGLVATTVLAVAGHIVPDAIMHFDVRPFAPLTDSNPLHGVMSLTALHWILVAMGIVGLALLAWRKVKRS